MAPSPSHLPSMGMGLRISPPASAMRPPILIIVLLMIAMLVTQTTEAFSVLQPARTIRRTQAARTRLCATSDDAPSKKKKGDSLRDATGIRPSLHPTTINCVAEALLLRSRRVLIGKDIEEIAIDTSDPQTEPLQIAITAAGIAMVAIDKRSDASKTDETTDAFTAEESQVVSGRVVGVVMRMRELERTLLERVNDASWVRKYGEEESFGVLKNECKIIEAEGDVSSNNDEGLEKQLAETIKMNPLLRMNRAECLLALFLSTVERPKMEMLGESVPGGSEVEFIDADRLEVLLPV